ncbi:right-handed parallel beta-helix repeat-containing protein [Catenulispora yoronensis]
MASIATGLAAVPFLVFAPAVAAASVINVGLAGVNSATCGSVAAPCRTISYAYSVRAAAGDTIKVGPGTFGSADPEDGYGFLNITKTVHLEGAQAGVDARNRSGPETVIANDYTGVAPSQMFYVDAAGVTVDGFTFDGSNLLGHDILSGAGVQTSKDSAGWQVINDVFTHSSMGAYLGSSASSAGNLVTHDLFDHDDDPASTVGNAGIYSDHPLHNVLITENTFREPGNPVLIATSDPSTPSTGIEITHNDIAGGDYMSFYAARDVTITDNAMDGGTGGVALGGGVVGMDIERDTMSGKTEDVILAGDYYSVGPNSALTVAENTMNSAGVDGLELADTSAVTIRHNRIQNSGHDGVAFTAAAPPVGD